MIDAFVLGLSDGWCQPFELTSGMTYPGTFRQLAWDIGSIVGQFFGRMAWRKPS